VACVTVADENSLSYFLLLETTPDEKIQKAMPYEGDYSCCSGNHFDAFGKLNDYFYLRTCGTGTAFCRSDLYIFKNITGQESQESVLEWYWLGYTGVENQFEQLSSTMELKKDSIFMHYKLEKGNNKEDKQKVETTHCFDVKYVIVNGKWSATDSTELKNTY